MTELVAILVVGLGAYFSRATLILVLADRSLPDAALVTLEFVAPAVLSALVVALLIDSNGQVAVGVPELTALTVAGAVTHRTKNHLSALIVGMAVYWLTRAAM